MSEETTTIDSAVVEPPVTEPRPLPEVTPAAEWKRRARAVYTLRLPSGFVCKAKRPDFMRLAINGTINIDTLVGAQSSNGVDFIKAALDITPYILPHVLVDPRVTLSESDDSITPADIADIDHLALFSWASGRMTQGTEELAVE